MFDVCEFFVFVQCRGGRYIIYSISLWISIILYRSAYRGLVAGESLTQHSVQYVLCPLIKYVSFNYMIKSHTLKF